MAGNNKEIIVSQNNILKSYRLHTSKIKSGEDPASNRVKMEHENNISIINRNTAILNKIISYNNIVFVFLLAFLIILIILLYYLLISNTHRISGPVLVMTEYINDIIKGKFPDIRPLRGKDEFKEFYDLFSKMVETLKERDKEKR